MRFSDFVGREPIASLALESLKRLLGELGDLASLGLIGADLDLAPQLLELSLYGFLRDEEPQTFTDHLAGRAVEAVLNLDLDILFEVRRE